MMPEKIKPGHELIAAERRRQVEELGWDSEYDDLFNNAGELALAAACYAHPGYDLENDFPWERKYDSRIDTSGRLVFASNQSPEKRIELLTKAGALVAAEIDRLQRRATKGGSGENDR
ncbi:MAG: hypothetical protein AAFV46_00070 [Cyanobacteria bacterium J06635_11]